MAGKRTVFNLDWTYWTPLSRIRNVVSIFKVNDRVLFNLRECLSPVNWLLHHGAETCLRYIKWMSSFFIYRSWSLGTLKNEICCFFLLDGGQLEQFTAEQNDPPSKTRSIERRSPCLLPIFRMKFSIAGCCNFDPFSSPPPYVWSRADLFVYPGMNLCVRSRKHSSQWFKSGETWESQGGKKSNNGRAPCERNLWILESSCHKFSATIH